MQESRGTLFWFWPLVLYLTTCGTTSYVGYLTYGAWTSAFLYSGALMFILSCHELGHYIQTRRYGVPASLPHFLPIPMQPFGTFGAIITMGGRIPNIRALFDIGISGPLAGLVPTLVCCYLGVKWSYIGPHQHNGEFIFGEPLVLQWFTSLLHGPVPPDLALEMHPLRLAGWIGLFITTLNLMPFSQLDGGHVFYALAGRRAGPWMRRLFLLVVFAVMYYGLWTFILILALLYFMGISHPPTQNDHLPLGTARRVLGWATLLFVLIGFTPNPVSIDQRESGPPRYIAVRVCECAWMNV